jgi:magnesium chelatase subunit H
MRFVIVTLDAHCVAAFETARRALARELPDLEISMHLAAEWAGDPAAAERCAADLRAADYAVVTHIFIEEQIAVVAPALAERRADARAVACVMSAAEVMRQTKLGDFTMASAGGAAPSPWSPAAILRRLTGSAKPGQTTGEAQVRQLRRIPQLLRFIPGTAQDVRAYYLILQYWLAGSDENLANLVRFVVDRYGPSRKGGRRLAVAPPVHYPEVGVYHPDLPGRGLAEDAAAVPAEGRAGRVGLLVMRSHLLGGNTAHYDALIRAFESRGLATLPAFAYGLDGRPAVERYFRQPGGGATVDVVVSLTGFSLVGGPAYNDASAARELLESLDVPYLSLQSLEFQSIPEWEDDARGLNPLQATLQVAIPELDGATGPMVFGGRAPDDGAGEAHGHYVPVAERVARVADRVAKLVTLRRRPKRERKVAIVLFNFPPNAGNTGTAAYLSVFPSLHNVLTAMRADGYSVEVPATVDELRERIIAGNSATFGAHANVHARIPTDDHVRREPHLSEIEAQWGPAPGRPQTDGASIFVLGERFGNAMVAVQPSMGYEGDPMRLLFERGFAPTHAFSAFYRWLREDFGADVVLHFGTHGALEFMPGKQVGLTAACWPDRLLGDLPNVYLYASNNPSEGTIAKRRGQATLVSYLTPPIAQAGLYRGLLDLRATVDRYRNLAPDASERERHELAELVQTQAAALDLVSAAPVWNGDGPDQVGRLAGRIVELEETMIPTGMHVVGEAPTDEQRAELLQVLERGWRAASEDGRVDPAELARVDRLLREDHETPGLLRALDGRYVAAAPGADLLRNAAVLPTGRNLYGFDPYRVPSTYAVRDGRRQADRLLARHLATAGSMPETVAMVLWGTDNMKTEGGPIAQALALLGAEPRFDGLGRLAGARLLPLEALGRPRVDVVLTLSGIFRDLLPLQVRLLAEAALLAARADEPVAENFVRKHALATAAALGCDLETAALRVFSNAEGAYGSNVNHLVESGRWQDDGELAETFVRRKSFAYGVGGRSVAARGVMQAALATVELAYQNLDSVELGVTDIDYYYESLGGIAKAAAKIRGGDPAVYVGDQTRGEGTVRTLAEQVALETRTRTLNPKWFEGMLAFGYEGVRQIEAHVANTVGWSATTGAVPEWVYRQVSETFVLDEAMRERLAGLNPHAAAKLSQRLLEANDRGFWRPDAETLDALQRASEELEDRLEGVLV